MTECTHEEFLAEIERIAADLPGWSDANNRYDWHEGWGDDE